jgi:hypothetical protein
MLAAEIAGQSTVLIALAFTSYLIEVNGPAPW